MGLSRRTNIFHKGYIQTMAKRKAEKRKNEPVGFEPNNKCPYCKGKVRVTRELVEPKGTLVVFHWWAARVCLSDESAREADKEGEDV